MKKLAIVLAMSVAAAGMAVAGPKDKISETLINPDSLLGNASWNNATVASKVKSVKCKVQIGAKANPAGDLADGKVICISDADTILGGTPTTTGNSLVMAGEIVGGKLKLKGDVRSIGCGSLSAATITNALTTCYQEDIANYDAATECGNAGMVWIPPGVLPTTDAYNPGNVVGACQGTVANGMERIPAPVAPVLAITGSYSPIL